MVRRIRGRGETWEREETFASVDSDADERVGVASGEDVS